MPKPVYILCSKSGAEDAGSLSIFEIIEKFIITKIPAPPSEKGGGIVVVESTKIRVTAVWMRSEGDEGKEFEGEFAAIFPPHESRLELGPKASFSFTQNFYRLTGIFQGLLPIQEDGMMWITCRIREVGTSEWNEQRYPILLELKKDIAPTDTPAESLTQN